MLEQVRELEQRILSTLSRVASEIRNEFPRVNAQAFSSTYGRATDAPGRIASRLQELNIPFALACAMAMFLHGCRRFTENIDLLVTRESLDEIHRQLVGRRYVLAGEKS